jgi:hypothetical protein
LKFGQALFQALNAAGSPAFLFHQALNQTASSLGMSE